MPARRGYIELLSDAEHRQERPDGGYDNPFDDPEVRERIAELIVRAAGGGSGRRSDA
jgi:hypothetical protein